MANSLLYVNFKSSQDFFCQCDELHIDKTFRRTNCNELEINAFDTSTETIITLSRVFTNYESAAGYHKSFSKVFGIAEADMHKKLRWGHIYQNHNETRIRAILVNEHLGQVGGLGQYFAEEYKQHDADWHIHRIVKVCRIHYERSIRKLRKMGVSTGFSISIIFH